MSLLNICAFCCEIGDVNHRLGFQHASRNSFRIARILRALACFRGKKRWHLVGCDEAQSVVIPAKDISKVGLADAHGLLKHGLEHWLKIAGRAIDDLKNLGRSGLLL